MTLRTYFATDRSLPDSLSLLESGSLYHSTPWHRVLIEGFNVQVEHLVTEIDGAVVALTPIVQKRLFGFSFCGSPLQGVFTEFIGPRFSRDLTIADRSAVVKNQISLLRNHGYSYIEIGVRADGTIDGGEVFKEIVNFNFSYHPRPSLTIDLTRGLDQTWAGFEGRARNMIRKAEKNAVVVEVEPLDAIILAEYGAMIEATFRRQGLAIPHPFAAYIALARNLEPISRLMFVSARLDGRLLSGGIFLTGADRMVFHSGSSNPEGATLAASSLVQWKAIQEGYRRGIYEYDLGGIGVGSIDKFKQSFGGIPIHHHRWVYSSNFIKWGTRSAHWLAAKGLLRVFG